jgi:hypothetical protein
MLRIDAACCALAASGRAATAPPSAASNSRKAQSSPRAHRGARVIGTDALRILLISQEPSDGEERNQDNEDNPNVDAHQSRLLPPVRTRGACQDATGVERISN